MGTNEISRSQGFGVIENTPKTGEYTELMIIKGPDYNKTLKIVLLKTM